MNQLKLRRFWDELRRRRVVRAALYYVAGAWVLAQATDLMLDAFSSSQYMRYVVAALILGLPIAILLAWMFELTPGGIERTAASDAPAARPFTPAPEHSVAVLPFANLSQDLDNEYFSDGLSEEIRNQLAQVTGLRVAARTSSFAFKGRHEDVREIGRQLNVANLLEGGVRKQAGTVRIDVHLVDAANGFQVWSQSFERRLDDIFQLQSEVAAAVIAAVTPRSVSEAQPAAPPMTRSFDAYNLYLLGRHHFHRRSETSLQRAVACFQSAIALDADYALAYSGLADASTLSSTGYYGNVPAADAFAQALQAAQRAIALAPEAAESHASLGLVRLHQGDRDQAEAELLRALAIDPGYALAHVWHGLVLTAQGRYREAAARNREAFRLDPLSPIVNSNVGFDALRFGDETEAAARFAAAMEIDPGFPVPYSGMARLNSMRGDLAEARRWIELAIDRAPTRAFYLARKGLVLLQLGAVEEAAASIESAYARMPEPDFGADIIVALRIVQDDRAALLRIAMGNADQAFSAAQRAQAMIALGDAAAATALYAALPMNAAQAIADLINDDWVWRLPHFVNHAQLRLEAGDASARDALAELLAEIDRAEAQGVMNPDITYWAASAHAVLGQHDDARRCLAQARIRGWRHEWWARCDHNLRGVLD